MTHQQLLDKIVAREARVRDLQRRDPDRFKPNTLGPKYRTREERYQDLLDRLARRFWSIL